MQQKEITKREELVREFLDNVLCYPVIKYQLSVNDDSDPDHTAFEVKVSNTTNDDLRYVVLACTKDEEIQILKGEEFYDTTEGDFAMYLFLGEFLTVKEY